MKKRRSDKHRGKPARGAGADHEALGALAALQAKRTLFEPAIARIVQAALTRAGLDGGKAPIVEIGSGGGQLRRWLPEHLLALVVHTEREAAFARKLQQTVPHAKVQVASAEALPYADASVAAVLGLCVLDVVDLEAVGRELQRILAPGGAIVQFWDLAPNLGWLCARAMATGQVLLPGCFSDPLVRAELPAELHAALPPLDFMQDLVSVPRAQLDGLIALLRPSPTDLIDGPGLARLADHARLFDPATNPDSNGTAAAKALAQLCEDERRAHGCKRLMLNMWLILQQARGGDKLRLELTELSSAQALAERLSEAFTPLGLQVECTLQRARAVVPRPPTPSLQQARFVGRWLGTTALAAAVPPATADVLAADALATSSDLVVEAGVLVLVARRPAAAAP